MRRYRPFPFTFLLCLSLVLIGCHADRGEEKEKLRSVDFYYKYLTFDGRFVLHSEPNFSKVFHLSGHHYFNGEHCDVTAVSPLYIYD